MNVMTRGLSLNVSKVAVPPFVRLSVNGNAGSPILTFGCVPRVPGGGLQPDKAVNSIQRTVNSKKDFKQT